MAQLQDIVAQLAQAQKATENQMKETDRKLKELGNLFSSQWGMLVEALMRPGTVRLFRERGVQVNQMMENRKGYDGEGRELEFDMVLVDGGIVIGVEIKTRMKVEQVDWLRDKLGRFREAFREYRGWEVQGAVAALRYEQGSDAYAYRKGLWVMKCGEGVASLANDEGFRPASF